MLERKMKAGSFSKCVGPTTLFLAFIRCHLFEHPRWDYYSDTNLEKLWMFLQCFGKTPKEEKSGF